MSAWCLEGVWNPHPALSPPPSPNQLTRISPASDASLADSSNEGSFQGRAGWEDRGRSHGDCGGVVMLINGPIGYGDGKSLVPPTKVGAGRQESGLGWVGVQGSTLTRFGVTEPPALQLLGSGSVRATAARGGEISTA